MPATRPYSFEERLARGQRGEELLDAYFEHRFEIRPATETQQRSGIDRVFTDRITRSTSTVEYKTDRRSHRTLNVFIELISSGVDRRPGWIITAQAQWLVYFLFFDQRVLLTPFARLRTHVTTWQEMYPLRWVPNSGYNTGGLIIPVSVFAKTCVYDRPFKWLRTNRALPPPR